MPIAPGSIAKRPRSSSRMSSTHGRDSVRPCHDPQTPRRPTDDDPLRRTPPGHAARRRPAPTIRTPTRPNRSPSTPSPSRAGGAAVADDPVAASSGCSSSWSSRSSWPRWSWRVALTALRPAVADAVMSIAEDNPAALQLPFVKDIVAEKLGPALTTPVSQEDDPGRVPGRARATPPSTIATKLETNGPDRRQPGVRVHRDRARA